jgi:hypothetical protein
MKFCSVCNFILKSNIDLYSIVTALIRVSLLMRKRLKRRWWFVFRGQSKWFNKSIYRH